MENVNIAGGGTISYLPLYQRDADKILSQGAIDSQSADNELGITISLLKDGKVVVRGDQSALFQSLNDWNSFKTKRVIDEPEMTSVLWKKNPYGKAFPNSAQNLVKELIATLGIQVSEQGGEIDENLLSKVDAALKGRSLAFHRRYMLNYIALIGEALMAKCKLKWMMQLDVDGDTWVPYLGFEDGYTFVVDVYEDIENDSVSLTENYEVGMHILKRTLFK